MTFLSKAAYFYTNPNGGFSEFALELSDAVNDVRRIREKRKKRKIIFT